MVRLSLRDLPVAVVEFIFHLVEALEADADCRAVTIDLSSGEVIFEVTTPKRRTGSVVQPPLMTASHRLPDGAVHALRLRCLDAGFILPA